MLEVDPQYFQQKMLYRLMQSGIGNRASVYNVPLNRDKVPCCACVRVRVCVCVCTRVRQSGWLIHALVGVRERERRGGTGSQRVTLPCLVLQRILTH